jgi:Sulfotransferase family
VIISHERRFIFLKTRKTAGSTIERFLLDHLGPDDVIVSMVGRQNHTGRWNPLPELRHDHSRAEVRLTFNQWRRGVQYYQHMPAWRVRERVSHDVWNSYFKFCFERDPWDKLVSFYWWRIRDMDDPPDFETFVRTTPGLSAWKQYTIDDRITVDFVGRYENLEGDLRHVIDRIGIDGPLELERLKGSFRREEPNFSPSLDEWVSRHFAHEIAEFGYRDRSISGHV